MRAFTLHSTLVSLDPLNIPVMEKIAVKKQHVLMVRSPPSSGPARESLPVIKRQLVEGTLTGSTRLVLVTVLASRLPSTKESLMGSAKLAFLVTRASTQLVMVDQLIRVSRNVCVTHVPVHLMTQVSLTSVVTNWTLVTCSTSSTISSSPRLTPKTRVLFLLQHGRWVEMNVTQDHKKTLGSPRECNSKKYGKLGGVGVLIWGICISKTGKERKKANYID